MINCNLEKSQTVISHQTEEKNYVEPLVKKDHVAWHMMSNDSSCTQFDRNVAKFLV